MSEKCIKKLEDRVERLAPRPPLYCCHAKTTMDKKELSMSYKQFSTSPDDGYCSEAFADLCLL